MTAYQPCGPTTPAELAAWLAARPADRSHADRLRDAWRLPARIEDWPRDEVVSVYRELIVKPEKGPKK